MGRRALACVVAGLAIYGCGCGGSEDEAAPPTLDELAELVPSGQGVAATDLVAAKEALGLAPETDPAEGIAPRDVDATDAERRFARAAVHALRYIAAAEETPLLDAIDEAQVTAAVSTTTQEQAQRLTVFATDQSFEEIAGVLEQRGWVRDGETLEAEDTLVDPFSAIAAGDGYIALGRKVDVVEAAAAGETQPAGPDRDLALELADPAAVAREFDEECVEVIAIADHLAGGEAEMVLVPVGEPDPKAFLLDDAGAKPPEGLFQYRSAPVFGEAAAEDDRLVMPFAYPVEAEGTPLTDFAPGFLRTSDLYRCD